MRDGCPKVLWMRTYMYRRKKGFRQFRLSEAQKQDKRVLKSIGFNQVTFANGGNHAESPLTHY